jgi:hypothetical protein
MSIAERITVLNSSLSFGEGEAGISNNEQWNN